MKTELVNELKQKLSKKYYPIKLLMLVKKEDDSNSSLFISTDILKNNLSTISQVYKELLKILTNEELRLFSGIDVVEQRSNFFTEMKDYLENNGNPNKLYNLEFGGLKINRALIIISPVDNSKKYVREAELKSQLQDSFKQLLIQLRQFLEIEYVTRDELKQWENGKNNFSILGSEKQDLLLFSASVKALQDKRNKTIFQKDSINE
ncbi:MAG: hypothetical protein KAH84_04420 [Thiomargarita sp.]|nr:hypothetical protein [Thiomargarita sp.]